MKKQSIVIGGMIFALVVASSGSAFARNGGGFSGGKKFTGASASFNSGAGARGMKSSASVTSDRIQLKDRLQDPDQIQDRLQDPTLHTTAYDGSGGGGGKGDMDRLRDPDGCLLLQ